MEWVSSFQQIRLQIKRLVAILNFVRWYISDEQKVDVGWNEHP